MKEKIKKILKFGLRIKALIRVFPYGNYLITVFPVFAILVQKGLIVSIWSLLYILPFVSIMAAGFGYNTICDAKKDPKEKNVITRGDMSKNSAYFLVMFLLIFSPLLFLSLYKSIYALAFFIFYVFLWLAYSGIKIRFKENYLGPVVASIVLWVAAPITLAIEFNLLDSAVLYLLLGLFFIYIGYEIRHTLGDYDMDLAYNCKTFAVIFGKKYATIIEYISLIIGYLLLLISVYCLLGPSLIDFTILFTTLLIFIRFPFIVTRIFIIVYSCTLLQLPTLLILFIIWILLIRG